MVFGLFSCMGYCKGCGMSIKIIAELRELPETITLVKEP